MYILYNIILAILSVIFAPLACAALLSRKKYRAGFLEKCGMLRPRDGAGRPIWVHAVSVGEVMAAVPLIKRIKQRFPDVPLVVSTITETGNQTAHRNLKQADRIMYFPFDYPFIVRRVVRAVNPRVFIMLETEIWPNFLRELSRRSTPVLMISGRISERSFRNYKLFSFFFKQVLAQVSRLCMQTAEDAQRIIDIGAPQERVLVGGNIKFDLQVPPITLQEQERLRADFGFAAGQQVFIAGSTHKGEEEIVLSVFAALRRRFPQAALILAPRHPERFDETEALLRQSGLPYVRRTALQAAPCPQRASVVLLDTIGELFKTYSMGTVVFIGGSLVPVGGHNVLEPAVFGKPVIFGRHMHNFREIARMLRQKQAGIQVAGPEQFMVEALRLFEDPAACEEIGRNAFLVIQENIGAVQRSVAVLEDELGHNAR
ncbi:MAG: 3-deoxy-D-manno-octulosonic acid transferase [Deltaproteobacteria bacterium]|nr:3-deoxy-D-manno-octulosonic acid transferase [Deltaproteobacteria bacterium]